MLFRSTGNRGFQIVFENGWEVSVQFGTSNYCSRRDLSANFENEMSRMFTESATAEVAVYDPHGNMVIPDFEDDSDTVVGWADTENALRIMNWAASREAF